MRMFHTSLQSDRPQSPLSSTKEFKVIMIGDTSGKSTMLQNYIFGEFLEEYPPTLGAEYRPLYFDTSEGVKLYNNRYERLFF